MGKFVDMTGKKIPGTKWTVVKYLGSKRGMSNWQIRCECGTLRESLLNNQFCGKSNSCGCGRKNPRAQMMLNQSPQPAVEGFVIRNFCGTEIRQRGSDRYFDATAMCKVGGKLIGHWRSLKETRDYLSALHSVIGITITELVVSVNGGDPNNQGTWIHPRAAMRLAQWISPEFAIAVDGWVLDMVEGRVPVPDSPSHLSGRPVSEEVPKPKSILSGLPSLVDAQKELETKEREVKALRVLVSTLKRNQKLLAFTE
jgi:hypothetical protein